MSGKESALVQAWEGEKLVAVEINCPTAGHRAPTKFEEEIIRIFAEHRALKKMVIESRMLNYCHPNNARAIEQLKKDRVRLRDELEIELQKLK